MGFPRAIRGIEVFAENRIGGTYRLLDALFVTIISTIKAADITMKLIHVAV